MAKKSFYFFCFLLIFFAHAIQVFATDLSFTPSVGIKKRGETFSVTVSVTNNSQSINAASGVITFPKDTFSVSSITKAGSIINYWTEEPSYSNDTGKISFEGVVLNPGFSGSRGTLFAIQFKVLKDGKADVAFSEGAILANDGQATNVLRSLGKASFSIENATAAQPIADAFRPHIRSSTHQSELKWYQNNSPVFSWDLPENVTDIRYGFSTDATKAPTILLPQGTRQKKLANFYDGAYYFHLQFKEGKTWGPVGRYAFKIDSTPPLPFTITSSEKEYITTLSFQTNDEHAGVQQYVLRIDDGEDIIVPPEFAAAYELPQLDPGEHHIEIVAIDGAGNESAQETIVTTPVIPEGAIASNAMDDSFINWKQFHIKEIFIIIISAAVLYIFYLQVRILMLKLKVTNYVAETEALLKEDAQTIEGNVESEIEHLLEEKNQTPERKDAALKKVGDNVQLIERGVSQRLETIRKYLE